MSTLTVQDTVGDVVARYPALTRVLEQMDIDYCCGGKMTLEEAARDKGLDAKTLVIALEASAGSRDGSVVDASAMSLTDLADHIEQTHHVYLRSELPRLSELTAKVARVHGEHDGRLAQVSQTLEALSQELYQHMMKEEQVLFPMVRQLEQASTTPQFHCGSLANPVRQMELEHDTAGDALGDLRKLTDNFTLPEWGCNSYRAMLDGLAELEGDLHQHIHKENNVLFPRALEMEKQKCA